MSDKRGEAIDIINRLAAMKNEERLRSRYWANPDPACTGKSPYVWQANFHNAGHDNVERCLLAGNRTGKTDSALAEDAMHLTGEYAPWWKGKRFTHPIEAWIGAQTNESSRDITQKGLLGGLTPDLYGTGWIPKRLLDPSGPAMRQCGIQGVADTVRVKHASGGWSVAGFKSYEQGWMKWQGTNKHVIHLDEAPPWSIYSEALTRVFALRGIIYLTYTPLDGVTDVALRFIEGGPGIFLMGATWDDAPHLNQDEKARLIATYPEHERDARTKGVPMMGTGAVIPVADSVFSMDPIQIPRWWRKICGIDFGFDHPAAACWMAQDPSSDTWYVYDCYRMAGQTPLYHADAINQRGKFIPVAWPHDGENREKGTGINLATQYREKGVNMIYVSARYNDEIGSGQSAEPAIMDIIEKMRNGTFKVFNTLKDWFSEKRFWHRKDGVPVRKNDDVMKSMLYAWMMRRYASTPAEKGGLQTSTMAEKTAEQYNPLSRFRR